MNELLGNILVVSPCCRLHGANLCKQLGGADRGSTAGLVEATPRVMHLFLRMQYKPKETETRTTTLTLMRLGSWRT